MFPTRRHGIRGVCVVLLSASLFVWDLKKEGKKNKKKNPSISETKTSPSPGPSLGLLIQRAGRGVFLPQQQDRGRHRRATQTQNPSTGVRAHRNTGTEHTRTDPRAHTCVHTAMCTSRHTSTPHAYMHRHTCTQAGTHTYAHTHTHPGLPVNSGTMLGAGPAALAVALFPGKPQTRLRSQTGPFTALGQTLQQR